MIPRHVKTLSQLVLWLADEYHEGKLYHVAKAVKVSPGLVSQWKDETIKRPSDASLERLCAVYGLEFWEVMALTRRRKPPIPIAGGSNNDRTPGVPQVLDLILLIRRRLRQFLYPWYPAPTWSPRLAWA